MRITLPNKRIEVDGTEYIVYELWDGDNFICAAYGSCSLLTLGILADRLSKGGNNNKPSFEEIVDKYMRKDDAALQG